MIRVTRLAPVAIALSLSVAAFGCGDDNSPAANKAAFCKTTAEIDAATADIHSQADAVAAFTKVKPKIDHAVDQAPTAVKADTQVMADAVDNALSTSDFGAFENGSLDAASQSIESFCG
jgi:ABC-type transporter Mla subunit MlaD